MKKILLFALLAIFTTASFAAKKESKLVTKKQLKTSSYRNLQENKNSQFAVYFTSSCGAIWVCEACGADLDKATGGAIQTKIDAACGTDIDEV